MSIHPLDFHKPEAPWPRYSTMSRPPKEQWVFGADWPRWQRRLYPVTYKDKDERHIVEARLDVQRALVVHHRLAMWRSLRQGDRRMVAAHRRQLDQHARWVRNCETQLRLIAATEAYLEARKEAA